MMKFTILTLMMILGMSSVSFGKSYLCIPERGTLLTPNKNHITTKQSEFDRNRFLVKTEGNNRKMISVKFFGESYYMCKVGEVYFEKGHGILSGVGESIKGGDFLTCRQPHTTSNGGYTQNEFNLNIKTKKFNFYNMEMKFGGDDRFGQTFFGKCEEI